MDEMEMSINLQAIRLAWVYSLIFLCGWVWYSWLTTGLFQWMPFVLMTSQLLVYWLAQLCLQAKLGR